MLEAINYAPPRAHQLPSRQRQHVHRTNKSEFSRKYVNLNFQEAGQNCRRRRLQKSSSPSEQKHQQFYHTFYPKDKPKLNRNLFHQSRKTGRETAFSQRQSIICTPFASLQVTEVQPVPALPSLDKQRYRYLLSVVSGISKLKRIAQYRTSYKLDSQHKAERSLSPGNNSPQVTDFGSPRVVNLSADFRSKIKGICPLEALNSYQKVYKNKQLLQKGRYNSVRQNSANNLTINILGEDDFKIQQAPLQQRKVNKKIAF